MDNNIAHNKAASIVPCGHWTSFHSAAAVGVEAVEKPQKQK